MIVQSAPAARAPLPRHCSDRPSPDQVLYEGGGVVLGRFRCAVGHPAFRDSGPIRRAVVVFPRTSVWIRHEGERPFVADANVVTIYNRAQRYERAAIAPEGDDCAWLALSDALALDASLAVAPRAVRDPARPYAYPRASGSALLYLRQRALFTRAAAGTLSRLEAEEETLAIVAEVLRRAHEDHGVRRSHGARAERRRRDLAERAREALARDPLADRSVGDLAALLGSSPFHLCRVFREYTGTTMHGYRAGLRLRRAIDAMGAVAPSGGLSAIAHASGFASHSHLVRVCRRDLGLTPSGLRRALLARDRRAAGR